MGLRVRVRGQGLRSPPGERRIRRGHLVRVRVRVRVGVRVRG